MEDKVTAFARESFPQMSEEERREAIRSLRKLIDEEMFAMAAGADEKARAALPLAALGA